MPIQHSPQSSLHDYTMTLTSCYDATCVPNVVQPCAPLLIAGSSNPVPGRFHLLACGHIIAVVDQDSRCGRNCLHAQRFARTCMPGLYVAYPLDPCAELTYFRPAWILPPISASQLHDELYCEVC